MIQAEVEYGPALRASLDVLDLAYDVADAMPEHESQRAELLSRVRTLKQMIVGRLRLTERIIVVKGKDGKTWRAIDRS